MHFPRFSLESKDLRSSTQAAQLEPSLQEADAQVLARALHRAGMPGVTLFVLGMLKPLHWIGGQALWVLQPFTDALGMGARHSAVVPGLSGLSTSGIARLLEREDGLDDLAANLEKLQSRRDDDGAA